MQGDEGWGRVEKGEAKALTRRLNIASGRAMFMVQGLTHTRGGQNSWHRRLLLWGVFLERRRLQPSTIPKHLSE